MNALMAKSKKKKKKKILEHQFKKRSSLSFSLPERQRPFRSRGALFSPHFPVWFWRIICLGSLLTFSNVSTLCLNSSYSGAELWLKSNSQDEYVLIFNKDLECRHKWHLLNCTISIIYLFWNKKNMNRATGKGIHSKIFHIQSRYELFEIFYHDLIDKH